MNILFCCQVIKDHTNGVWKKVEAQVKALRKIHKKVDFVYLKNNNTAVLDLANGNNKVEISLLHRYSHFISLIAKINNDYDVIYMRKPHGGLFPISAAWFIRKIKCSNPNARIYLEIPTYPYKLESRGHWGWLKESIFEFSMKSVRKNINEILYIGEQTNSILGVPARAMANGVDLDAVQKVENKILHDSFIFLGIANLMFWHGYDRLIKAISNYKGDQNILFYIIGDTEPELTRLKKLTSELSVDKHIIFLGKKKKEELNDFLQVTNVCVDALGRHRSGNNINDSLKSKEYSAMGIPFIKSHIDYSLGSPFYVFQVSGDEEDISIDDIIKWYSDLPVGVNDEIRAYAEENFSWELIMGKAINGDDIS